MMESAEDELNRMDRAKHTFKLTEVERTQQQALNTLEALAIDRAKRANEEIQQVAKLTEVLRERLVRDISNRVGVPVSMMGHYQIDDDGKATFFMNPPPAGDGRWAGEKGAMSDMDGYFATSYSDPDREAIPREEQEDLEERAAAERLQQMRAGTAPLAGSLDPEPRDPESDPFSNPGNPIDDLRAELARLKSLVETRPVNKADSESFWQVGEADG